MDALKSESIQVLLVLFGFARHYERVNMASENLSHHLEVLQRKLEQGKDYEQALYYFLEEFAGDARFVQQCEPEEALHLMAALGHVATTSLGKNASIEQPRAFRLPQFRFIHGNAAVSGRIVLFFYFEQVDTGLMALIPGTKGGTEVARFRLTGGLAGNPKHN